MCHWGSSFDEVLKNPVKAVLPEAERIGVKIGMTGAAVCDILNYKKMSFSIVKLRFAGC